MSMLRVVIPAVLLLIASARATWAAETPTVASARSGTWTSGDTWVGGKVPPAGSRVQIRAGHEIIYDANAETPIRAIFLAGRMTFSTDRDTRLDVGIIKIQSGQSTSEEGVDPDDHASHVQPGTPTPALEVGSQSHPIERGHTALIRLVYFEGMDRQAWPGIVDCGGRLDFHGAQMTETWSKLGATARKGDRQVVLDGQIDGWRPGDRVILVSTNRQNKAQKTFRPSVRDSTQTEERLITHIDGAGITLDRPLEFEHLGDGAYRGEVANLSRNVVIESADPSIRGHTMYHRGSTGSIGYAEFRRLGKEGVLGRYSVHFHLCRDTMRGTSVVGASIWDSANRWITIHGSDYVVVRDCVGYNSVGHGFFLEDGTETFNVFDHNLAVQACAGKPLPGQMLPFDHNEGAGFWWANSLNAFTRNVAAECDEYGYRFDAPKADGFDPRLPVPRPDGTRSTVDIRTLPFVRFEDNEAHTQRRHSFNLGGFASDLKTDVGGVGPDEKHPFVIRNFKVWDAHWALHPGSPSVMVDGLDVHHAEYALWRANYDHHAYRGIHLDDVSIQADFSPRGLQPAEREFPAALSPIDDLPPATVIMSVSPEKDGSLRVCGTTCDNGVVKRVVVNGKDAAAVSPNFAQWQITFEKGAVPATLSAHAEDAAGNIEPRAHILRVKIDQ